MQGQQECCGFQKKANLDIMDSTKIPEETKNLYSELNFLRKKLELLNQKESVYQKNFTGIAFLIFNTQQECSKFYEQWKIGPFKHALLKLAIFFNLTKVIPKLNKNYLIWQNQVIGLTYAAAPSDVWWKNLGVSVCRKLARKTLTLSSCLFSQSICIALITVIKYYQVS
jgi:hypothetical protein